jgi:membrane associated rhomboid family serine protease
MELVDPIINFSALAQSRGVNGETVKDPRIVTFLVLWVALNVYFGLSAVMVRGAEGNIAWEAHIGGFLCGLLLFGLFDEKRARGAEPPLPSSV